MKRLKLFWICSLALVSLPAVACGPWYLNYNDGAIYRIMPYGTEEREAAGPSFAEHNCRLWKSRLASQGVEVSLNDIYQAIYHWNSKEWHYVSMMSRDRQPLGRATAWLSKGLDNTFVRHLVVSHDTLAADLIYWSKLLDDYRAKLIDPWHYGNETDAVVEGLLPQAEQRIGGTYLSRYLLLSVRICYTLHRDDQAVSLWRQWGPLIKDDELYDDIEGYVAGCLLRQGRNQEASDIYARLGDIASLQHLYKKPVTLMSVLFDKQPNNDFFPAQLQRLIEAVDYDVVDGYSSSFNYSFDAAEAKLLLSLSQRACRDPRVENKTMWRYVAACMLDYYNRPAEALKMIDGAAKGCNDAFLSHSCRVMEIYLHAQVDKLDGAYDQRLLTDLAWLDAMMRRKGRLAQIDYFDNYDTRHGDFFYAALTTILMGDKGLVDRMLKAGKTTRAIQLANMTENNWYDIYGDMSSLVRYRQQGPTKGVHVNLTFYRESMTNGRFSVAKMLKKCAPNEYNLPFYVHEVDCNENDYSNMMFSMVDAMDATTLERYWNAMVKPADTLGRFLNRHGYTDRSYWSDIIGTHHLRECNYAKAEQWLAKVDTAYVAKLNVDHPFDPFYVDNKVWNEANWKLVFATRMKQLETTMRNDANVNERAMAQLYYTVGLHNSFWRDWQLTGYAMSVSCDDYDDEVTDDWFPWLNYNFCGHAAHQVKVRRHAIDARVEKLRSEALNQLTDDEHKARGYMVLLQRATVIKRYPHTAEAQQLVRTCDYWRNYVSRRG